MKKLFLLLCVLVIGVTTTSFGINKQSPNDVNSGNEWVYFTSVTAWYSETESTVLYIWYKEGNGVRVYGFVNSKYSSKTSTPAWDDIVESNRLYQSKECNDFRRNYKYKAGLYVFNGFLPNMKNDNVINGWTYYTNVTAWYTETESTLLYIWYKEGNGVRVYGYVDSHYSNQSSTPGWGDIVERNDETDNFKRNYQYKAGCHVFNATLPMMK